MHTTLKEENYFILLCRKPFYSCLPSMLLDVVKKTEQKDEKFFFFIFFSPVENQLYLSLKFRLLFIELYFGFVLSNWQNIML